MSPTPDTPTVPVSLPAALDGVREQEQDQLHSGKTMKGQLESSSTRDAPVFRRERYRRNDTAALHEAGARRFGQAWFANQRVVIRIAKNYGLDPVTLYDFLPEMAWEICAAAETEP